MVHANFLYWLCLLVVCCFFVWQHTLVSEKNLAKVNVAFFNANRNISLTVFLAFLLNFIF
jgi:4-hydroxybenzoate polyprenyltransferase